MKRIVFLIIVLMLLVVVFVLAVGYELENNHFGVKELIVMPGDTIWEYWTVYGEGMCYGKWKDEVLKLNGMENAELIAGQIFKIIVKIDK